MASKNTLLEYGSVAKGLHWLIALLVMAMLLIGYFLETITPPATKSIAINLHKLTGLTILVLMLLRLFWRSINIKPALPRDTLLWQRYAERTAHFSLYALLIVTPLSGWLMAAAAGRPPHIGSLTFPLPIPENKAWGDIFFTTHAWVAIAIIAFLSVHVAAALYHYVVKKDQVLQRML